MSPPADEAPILEIEDLRTTFYTEKETIRAVDGISLDIHAGETVGLVGESGSGKSVTARSILGLVKRPGEIDAGSIRFRGEELTDDNWEAHRGDIAIVFQDPINSLNPVYTVGNQIREALRIHQGLRGAEANLEAIRLLESVDIPDAPRRVEEYPHQFSGGMRQRAVIAMALACEPDLLVCDEPTTALDVTIQAQILELLEDLQSEGMAILFITHDMGVIEEICDRVNVMYAGEIVERAAVEELFEHPQHPYTQGLLASIPGQADPDERLPSIEGEVPTPTSPATDCRFHPRCPERFEPCDKVHPSHVPVGEADTEHTAACLLYGDLDDHQEESGSREGADSTARQDRAQGPSEEVVGE
jgi:peptide/nickel transport system ATP-binding protein